LRASREAETIFFTFGLSWNPQATCSGAPREAETNFVVWPFIEVPSFVLEGSMRGYSKKKLLGLQLLAPKVGGSLYFDLS
jgi:hypothetical protein